MTEPLVPHDHDPATDGAGSGEAIMDKVTSAVDEFAKRAAPVVREVGARAAEVTAAAGVKAGPVAHRVADATEDLGQRLARKASDVASDLRRNMSGEGAAGQTTTPPADAPTMEPTAGGATPEPGTREPDSAA